ncbi:MAG: TlpA disulfide reductase family protein [Xanthomonadales bacterium]|jgi:thiol-disulfide isomerase/thioredoxin|nr:TlpA disulfide reductase family protein [Xanthomonadales bacterium]
MKYLFTLFSFLVLSLHSPVATAAGEVSTGGQLRNMPMQGLTGNSEFLSLYLGKPLIINVWASYCGPCLAEMGSLERLWQRHGDHFNVIGISIDDYRERAAVFLAKAGTTFPHYIDRQLMLEKMLGARTIPLTLLIDAEGRVLQKVRGAQEWDSPEIIETIGQIYKIEM